MQHGFVKVAAVTPKIKVADPYYNAAVCADLIRGAADRGVALAVFPELCLTGYTCGDLLTHRHLLRGALDALKGMMAEVADTDIVCVVGLPVAHADKVYNCAAVFQSGVLLGIVPKTHISGHGAMEEARYFAPAPSANLTYEMDGAYVPFGTRQLFVSMTVPDFRFAVEIGEDLLAPTAPSATAAMAGATVICRPSATFALVGKGEDGRSFAQTQSSRLKAAYISAEAGEGESTTDVVFAGHAVVAENGQLLVERSPFSEGDMIITEVDTEYLAHERRRTNTFENKGTGEYTEAYFGQNMVDTVLTRHIDANPFVPVDPICRARRCEEALSIQSAGLKQRIKAACAQKLVIGISGGLDSTLALAVMVRAMDALERPRNDIIAVTMPGFGTTDRTKNNATVMCEAWGVDFRCVPIGDAVSQHFRDIGHDPSVHDVTYENAQARERTQVLMDIANQVGGMVVGTGDLSELALGFATYNGDHMSMYSVNGGVPKTLVRHLVAYAAAVAAKEGEETLARALADVVNTPVSPELLPATEGGDIAQKTEDLVGPYELHDFFLYRMLGCGETPSKIFRMARYAWGEKYDDATILHWLETFTRRFFAQQFKRSCLPDGPAIGSVSLSPRAGWRMPSDASSALWMAELRGLKE